MSEPDLSSFLMISVKHAASCAVMIARLGVVLFFTDFIAFLDILEQNKNAQEAPFASKS